MTTHEASPFNLNRPLDVRRWVVENVTGRRRCRWTWHQALLGIGKLSSAAAARRRSATRRQSTVANVSHTTFRFLNAGPRFVHLGFNGVDDMFSALLVARCEAAAQHALQHDVGCDKATRILHQLLCKTAEFLDELR